MMTRQKASRRVALTYVEAAARNAARRRKAKARDLAVASAMCFFVVLAVLDSLGAF